MKREQWIPLSGRWEGLTGKKQREITGNREIFYIFDSLVGSMSVCICQNIKRYTWNVCIFIWKLYFIIKETLQKTCRCGWAGQCHWLSPTRFHLLCEEVGKLLGVNCWLDAFLWDLESGKKTFPLCHLSMEFQVNSGLLQMEVLVEARLHASLLNGWWQW